MTASDYFAGARKKGEILGICGDFRRLELRYIEVLCQHRDLPGISHPSPSSPATLIAGFSHSLGSTLPDPDALLSIGVLVVVWLFYSLPSLRSGRL